MKETKQHSLKETLSQLQALTNDKMFKHNQKIGVGDNQYGVKLGDIKAMAKKIKTNHGLAMELWQTGNLDAMLLATLLLDLKLLSANDMDKLVRSVKFVPVADWFSAYVLKLHPDKETLRKKWMVTKDSWAARAGWALTTGRVVRSAEGLDLKALLDRIEKEMNKAAPEVQWTMNFVLGEIGINFPEHRKRAIAIGEKLGMYRDYPVSKGCTSPFVPIWVNEMVSRQK